MRVSASSLRLLIAIWMLVVPAVGNSATDQQPLRATAERIRQRFCYGDAETFVLQLKLRLRFVNRTANKLILDKEIGKAWYGVTVARNEEDLAAGKYESNPNIDWFFSDKVKLPKEPSLKSPGPGFALLAPGQAFDTEIDTGVVAQYDNPNEIKGAIRPGVHLFQMKLSAWNRFARPEQFEKRWVQFGQLVTGEIRTEPLEIHIPTNPNVENCR